MDRPTAEGSGKEGNVSSWSTHTHAEFLCRTIWTLSDLSIHPEHQTHRHTSEHDKTHTNLCTHGRTLIKLVWRRKRGPQDNIFIAIIKQKLAYDPPQANIWLWVSSIIHPLREYDGAKLFSNEAKPAERKRRKRKTVWAFTRLWGFSLINQTYCKCISVVMWWVCHWGGLWRESYPHQAMKELNA